MEAFLSEQLGFTPTVWLMRVALTFSIMLRAPPYVTCWSHIRPCALWSSVHLLRGPTMSTTSLTTWLGGGRVPTGDATARAVRG